jgi:hypothetical protein
VGRSVPTLFWFSVVSTRLIGAFALNLRWFRKNKQGPDRAEVARGGGPFCLLLGSSAADTKTYGQIGECEGQKESPGLDREEEPGLIIKSGLLDVSAPSAEKLTARIGRLPDNRGSANRPMGSPH